MPTWTVAPSSPRLPAATPSWSPMKALPLRPPAGKVCFGTTWNVLEKRCGELFASPRVGLGAQVVGSQTSSGDRWHEGV